MEKKAKLTDFYFCCCGPGTWGDPYVVVTLIEYWDECGFLDDGGAEWDCIDAFAALGLGHAMESVFEYDGVDEETMRQRLLNAGLVENLAMKPEELE